MKNFWNQVFNGLGTTDLASRFAAWLPGLFAAAITMVLFYALWRMARTAAAALIAKADLDPTAASFIQSVLKSVLLTVGAVTALAKVGINTASILTSLGVAGLTLGFAAKDALSNMISGLFIFWDRPFVIGDLVEVDGQYGRVESITMRSTRVVTPNGKMLAIPNATVINNTVTSYTNFPHLRLDVDFTVAVTEDLDRVREVALSACEANPALMTTPPARVVVTALNDYNVALQLQVWLENEKAHVGARHALREHLFEQLRTADVQMPFETFSLEPLRVALQNAPNPLEGPPPSRSNPFR